MSHIVILQITGNKKPRRGEVCIGMLISSFWFNVNAVKVWRTIAKSGWIYVNDYVITFDIINS